MRIYLLITDNKLLDIYPKHQLFYMMGVSYGVLFSLMGLLLMHPTIGLAINEHLHMVDSEAVR